jgi:hypothetical protein
MAKAGLDDHFAAGTLSVVSLRKMRQRYEPVDVGAERLKRDERLGLALEDLRRKLRARVCRTKGEYSERSIARYLLSIAPARAKLTPEGLHLEASKREIADGAGISDRTVTRRIPFLEDGETPFLRRDNEGRDPKERGAFVLLTRAHELARYCPHDREGATPEGDGGEGQKDFSSLSKPAYTPRGDTNALPSDAVPELRWPTLAVSRERDEKRGGWKLTYTYRDRLAKKRQAILEELADAGGELPKETLLAKFGTEGEKRRPWDFMRRTLGPLVNEPRTVELETVEGLDRHTIKREHATHPGPSLVEVVETARGVVVRLLPDWLKRLEEHRELAGELDAARLQKQKHRRQSAAFRHPDRDRHDQEPGMRPIDDLRQPFGFHPDGCACRACNSRFGQWISPHVPGCACADCFTARKEEHDAGVLPLPSRVAAAAQREQSPEQTVPAAVVTVLREVEPEESRTPETASPAVVVSIGTQPKRPPMVDGIFEHGPLCECEWCDAPARPRYARAWSGA